MAEQHQSKMIDPGAASLEELEARIARDLMTLQQPAKDWVPPQDHPRLGRMLDVAILGAGMAGLAVAYVLKRQGLRNFRVYDRSPAGVEGPWVTYARMETLRSPKELAGPAVGQGPITFRAWYEAQFGAREWDKLYRIPREQWMDYLRWYRRVIDVPIENGVELADLRGDEHGAILTLRQAGATREIAARHVILATGRDGLGGPFVPPLYRALDRRYWAHSADDIDFAVLKGRTVGVLGAGASAADNAAAALEAGAAHVAMVVRRDDIPRINKGMGVAHPGMSYGFQRLDPARRWAMNQVVADCAVPPPHLSMRRVSKFPNFAVLTGYAPTGARVEDRQVVLETARGSLAFDFLILATGFAVDWSKRPELATIAPLVLRWRDRYVAPGKEASEFAEHPYLGADMEFLERQPGAAPWLSRIHCFNFGGTMSHGKVTGDIPAISVGAERIAEAVIGLLFTEDYEEHYRRLTGYETPELTGEEWNHDGDPAPFLWRKPDRKAGE